MARVSASFPKILVTTIIMLSLLSACGGSPATPQPLPLLPIDARHDCTVTTDGGLPFTTWFEPSSVTEAGSIILNGVANPANSITFPDRPNCSFYQWSEHMFMWLTSPHSILPLGGGSHIFDSEMFYDVSPIDENGNRTLSRHTVGTPSIGQLELGIPQVGPHRLPIIFDKSGRMLEVAPPILAKSGKLLILDGSDNVVEVERIMMNQGKPIFFNRAGDPIPDPKPHFGPDLTLPDLNLPSTLSPATVVQKIIVAGGPFFFWDVSGNVVSVDQAQAGDNGVLMAQNGSLVYYSTMVNDVFAYFLTGVNNNEIAADKFPTTQQDLDDIINFAEGHGKTIPHPEALAIELKTSWVETAGRENPGSYIVMVGTIPTYDTTDPDQWVLNGQKTVKLALVGMHIVGSTRGHPEMIWATFEHVNNTPRGDYAYITTNGATGTIGTSDATGPWLFSANNTGPFNNIHMGFNPPNIDANPDFSISASNTILMRAWGASSDQRPNPAINNTAESNTEIISINNDVRDQLNGSDVRRNYILSGATWTALGRPPSGSFNGCNNFPNECNEVGTSMLTNSTMETYQQSPDIRFESGGTNCFTCHQGNGTDISVDNDVKQISHIFGLLNPLFPPSP